MNAQETKTPPALHRHLLALGERQRAALRADSVAALRSAWPHREVPRARWVIWANVTMLRELRSL